MVIYTCEISDRVSLFDKLSNRDTLNTARKKYQNVYLIKTFLSYYNSNIYKFVH